MTIIRRLKHSVDINNPTWSGGSKTDSWTNSVPARISKITLTIRNSRGDFVSASTYVLLGSSATVKNDSEVRIHGETDVHPVIHIHRARGSRSSVVKYIEVYLG